MGLLFSRLINVFNDWGSQQARVLMLGLDAAGKTTLLYKLKLNETVMSVPTVGFNVETVTPVKGLTLTVWDVGGQDRIRRLWIHYCQNTEGLIYVIDSADRERIAEAREELFGILGNDEMRGVPVVVLANKQDLPDAVSASQVMDELYMNKLTGREWSVQETCVTSGEGIYEAMNQLSRMVKDFKKKRSTPY